MVPDRVRFRVDRRIIPEEPAAEVEAGRSEGRTMAEVAETLRRDGLAVEEVKVGSTPTALSAMAMTGVTECRPGNLHDEVLAVRGERIEAVCKVAARRAGALKTP